MTLCLHHNHPIPIKHISQRTGKKIPLDVETNEPHDCPMLNSAAQQQTQFPPVKIPQQQLQQQRRYH